MTKRKRDKIIGQFAIGTKVDRTHRDSYRGTFPRGWRTRGIVVKYNPKKQKYLIDGTKYIYNETGEFKMSESSDWYSRSQIEIIED